VNILYLHRHDAKPGCIYVSIDNYIILLSLLYTQDNCILDSDLTFLWDLEDSSVARNRTYLLLLIRLAGLVIVQESLQEDFPEELFPVIMLALARAPPQILSSSSSSSS